MWRLPGAGVNHSAIALCGLDGVANVHLASETRPQVKRDRLLRLPDVEAATGLKKSTIYLLMARGDFPRCVQVTPRTVAWAESTVLQWIQDRISGAVVGKTDAESER